MELNPNHPTTQAIHGQWHKFALLIMAKQGLNHIVISIEDIQDAMTMFRGDLPAITACEKEDGIHFRIVPLKEGEALARQEGGLPT